MAKLHPPKPKHISSPAGIRKLAYRLLSFAETVEKLNGPDDDEDVALIVQITDDDLRLVTGCNEDDRNFHFYFEINEGLTPGEVGEIAAQREGINFEED